MSGAPFDAWVFDLDNTLYPASDLYDEIGVRMNAYIARALRVDEAEANALRERYFWQYGATVIGLARHHGVDAEDFLADVHRADYAVLSPDPELAELIAGLPGRKFVFTNGHAGHAREALQRLGLAAHFDGVSDIVSRDLAAKPSPDAFARLIRDCGLEPSRTLLIDDLLRNLERAHEFRFVTALMGPAPPKPQPRYVGRWAADLKTLLRVAVECKTVQIAKE